MFNQLFPLVYSIVLQNFSGSDTHNCFDFIKTVPPSPLVLNIRLRQIISLSEIKAINNRSNSSAEEKLELLIVSQKFMLRPAC